MHESAHMSTGSVSKFREHEKIDRNSEIREMQSIILRSTLTRDHDSQCACASASDFFYACCTCSCSSSSLRVLQTIYLINLHL